VGVSFFHACFGLFDRAGVLTPGCRCVPRSPCFASFAPVPPRFPSFSSSPLFRCVFRLIFVFSSFAVFSHPLERTLSQRWPTPPRLHDFSHSFPVHLFVPLSCCTPPYTSRFCFFNTPIPFPNGSCTQFSGRLVTLIRFAL